MPFLLALAASMATSAGSATETRLRVGMDTRQPPWAWVPGLDYSAEDPRAAPSVTEAQLRKLQGLDVDVMNALAHRLGVTPRVVPTSWFSLEGDLLAKRFDVIVGSWTPNPRTPDTIRATASYYEWGLLVAVRAENTKVRSYADLDGLRVGHYRDPAVERSLMAMGRGRFQARDDADTLFADLKKGLLDAAIFDSLYVRWAVAREPAFRIVGEPLNRLGYHVGVRAQDVELYEKVQAAVKDLVASPEMSAIRKKWEGGGS